MLEVSLKPEWELRGSNGELLDRHCLPLLLAIDSHGRLTHAAAQLGLSYRHAWNLLKRWEALFGRPLVELERGRGARLTPLGARLLRAEQRLQARLAPQLMSLAAEVQTELNHMLEGPTPLLRIHASHGFAIAKLRERLERRRDLRWELQFKGAIEAMASLAQRDCELAGFHVPCGASGPEILKRYQPWLHSQQCILPFVIRRQGLIVPTENPAQLEGLADLARPGLRFVNRQRGSGTRFLFDHLLGQTAVDAAHLNGYQHEEFTHSAVAAFVASGMADAGFGVEAAAREFRLGFIPLAEEYYSLLCWKDLLDSEPAGVLVKLLGDPAFQAEIDTIAGYRSFHAGAVWTMEEALECWQPASGPTG